MHFPIASLASTLALLSYVSAQVVVTITSTVTVVTVTYTPPTTSTSTILVTVSGSPPPPGPPTSTKTVTVTATPAPPSASCPLAEWAQCGGEGYSGSCTSCGDRSVCKYKDVWYSYCSNLPKVETVVATVYNG